MWQAEADTELTLFASPATAVGQKALALAKRCYSTVHGKILFVCVFVLVPWSGQNGLVKSRTSVVVADLLISNHLSPVKLAFQST